MANRSALARAKLNLCLHVTGKRADGYHLLDSLVVFPNVADRITIEDADKLSITVVGPFAMSAGNGDDNLVIQAARLMHDKAAFLLEKNLPVGAGIGGGSADAAAVIRLLSKRLGRPLPDANTLAELGADVPVCVLSRPQRMQGIGEILSDIPALPEMWCVLANAGPVVPTPAVFKALETPDGTALPPLPDSFATLDDVTGYLSETRNDLEPPARRLSPRIDEVLSGLSDTGAALVRMSGSGGTCFALYATKTAALTAADTLREAEPGWWVTAAKI